MSLSGAQKRVLESALGEEILRQQPMAGGDLSTLLRLTLGSGRQAIVKLDPLAEAEGAMLRAIAATGCAAPEVLATAPGLLAMSILPAAGLAGDRGWAEAGRHVRRLHDTLGAGYGWKADHAFGRVAIRNAPAATWPDFWAERRLLDAPEDVPREIAGRLERLAQRLPSLLPAAPPAALLHGDLWSGNLLFGGGGFSGLIDPACYHGDAEVDLAMLMLFGRPPPAFFDAYGALDPGWEARRPVYQLWPALVHLRLFGAGYRGMVEGLLARLGV